jgi:MFS family permease
VLAALVGRIPIGIVSVAVVLLVQRATGSFADAGIVDAALALAAAVAAPAQGRLIDSLGQTKILALSASVYALSLAGLVSAALGHADLVVMTVAGAVAGASMPPLSGSMRTLWPILVGDERRLAAAFALESVAVELFFLAGPALCGVLVAIASPAAAVLAAAGLVLVGTALFATAPASRRWRPVHDAARTAGGALTSPGMRALALCILPEGMAFGILGVAVPAFAVRHGTAAAAGWLLAAQALGSGAGGLWYGTRRWSRPLTRRFAELSGLLALGLLPLALARSVGVLAALLVVGGVALAPATAAGYELVGRLAPAGTTTEAYTWLIAATVAGSAIGAAVGGFVVQGTGSPATAFLVATAAAALGPLVAVLARRSLAGGA